MEIIEVDVAGERFSVVGLGGMIVNAAHRRRRLARTVVGEAIARDANWPDGRLTVHGLPF